MSVLTTLAIGLIILVTTIRTIMIIRFLINEKREHAMIKVIMKP